VPTPDRSGKDGLCNLHSGSLAQPVRAAPAIRASRPGGRWIRNCYSEGGRTVIVQWHQGGTQSLCHR
jgi:hypothetical protein